MVAQSSLRCAIKVLEKGGRHVLIDSEHSLITYNLLLASESDSNSVWKAEVGDKADPIT